MALSSHDRLALVHATFAGIVTCFIIPLSILIARIAKGKEISNWFRIHQVMSIIAALLIVLVFALGVSAVQTQDEGYQFSGEESDIHHKLGLATFIIVMAQTALGFIAHKSNNGKPVFSELSSLALKEDGEKQSSKSIQSNESKGYFRILHILLGIITIALLFWTCWNGMQKEWATMSINKTTTPEAIQIIFWCIIALPIGIYIIDLGMQVLRMIERQSFEKNYQ